MRLIDADKLKPDAEWNGWDKQFTCYSKKQIENAPTVDARKRGEWVVDDDASILFTVYACSECGTKWVNNRINYCPNCGADMRGNDK